MISGWETVVLANRSVEVTVLPGKGGDVYSLVDKRTGVDVLMKTPAGLKHAADVQEQEPIEFLRNYEGGWQTLFPSAGDACTYRGRSIPFHGEVALKPWHWEPVGSTAVRLRVDCESVPLTLERVLSLAGEAAAIRVEDTVINCSDETCHFVLGHHCALGAPLIQRGAVFDAAAETIVTVDEYWDDSARIAARQRTTWPVVLGRDGTPIDVRTIAGPELASQDDLYLTDLVEGIASVSNPDLGLRLSLAWDSRIFRWLVLWQLFGAPESGSLVGGYALGVEPWTSRRSLEQAADNDTALSVAGRGVFRAAMSVRIDHY